MIATDRLLVTFPQLKGLMFWGLLIGATAAGSAGNRPVCLVMAIAWVFVAVFG